MKHLLHILFCAILLPSAALAQLTLQWQRTYGGTKNDLPSNIITTRDGGYLMTGATRSANGDVTENHGDYDLWLLKINADGSIKWQKTYGGSASDAGAVILETFDGGYIIGAVSQSKDGDLQGLPHHDTAVASDIWIFKIDSLGTIKWQKTFGGSGYDQISGIFESGEGEYIVLGTTQSADGDVRGNHGGEGNDIWLFRFSESGSIVWQKTLGGTKNDIATSFIKTSDNGYAILGYTTSTDGDVTGRRRDSSYDAWLIKLNHAGEIIWQKTYGGSQYEEANSVIETLDHGFAFASMTTSNDGDISGRHGPFYGDAWIVKTDLAGNIEWQKCYGGINGDEAFSIFQTSDSGYLIGASTASDDGDVAGFKGVSDSWVFKISKTGNLMWQKTLGGSFTDANLGAGIMPAADSGYLVVTMTESKDGDVVDKHGDTTDWDIWLVKLSPELAAVKSSPISNENISFYPNPSNGKTKIEYALDKPSEIKIELYNPLGEKLRTLLDTKEEMGNHEHEFDLSRLASGSYFLRIKMNQIISTLLIEVVK
jgi:hypothetical protein